MAQPMEKGISGFQVDGSWDQIVDHGDRISRILHELGASAHPRMSRGAYDDALAEWDRWRPRPADSLDEDLRPRTAKQASLNPKNGDHGTEAALQDLGRAWRALLDGPERIPDGGASAWLSRLTEATRLSSRAVATGVQHAAKSAEEAVYLHVMTQLSPCYFDNRVVSANLERQPGSDAYSFEININSDELKDRVGTEIDADAARRPGP